MKRLLFILSIFIFIIGIFSNTYILASPLDKDHDGFPDKAELLNYYDRENFRLWFVYIALSQYYHPSAFWNEKERDCAGLIRFSYKEALKRHDNKWFSSMPYLVNVKIPDVSRFNYPNIPILGTRIFRIAPGEFKKDELDNISTFFSPYANTYNLIKYNMVRIGKEDRDIKKGDILVFYNPYDPEMMFHTMIFIGRDPIDSDDGINDWLIYHTGPRVNDRGIIKKVRREMLRHHKDPRWRPIVSNPFFLGYFRFKILDYKEELK